MNKPMTLRPRSHAAVNELIGGRPVYYDKPSALQVEIDLRMKDHEILDQVRDLVERARLNRKDTLIPF
jgi:hypothetical protein